MISLLLSLLSPPKPRRRLVALFRAVFPRRYHATTKAEREAVAATSRAWRAALLVTLIALPVIVIAALHIFVRADHWLPETLS